MFVANTVKITPNTDNYKTTMDNIKKRISLFKDLTENEKIGKDEETGEYYIDKYTMTQKLSRWWYGENREKTVEYIKEEFKVFSEFLDIVYQDLNQYSNKFLILDFIKGEIFIFIDEIIPGLHSLKKTYGSYDPIINEVDSFIIKMLEFKEKINRKKERRNKPKRIHL